jgi:hypothetical protein
VTKDFNRERDDWIDKVLADHSLPARALHVALVIARHVNRQSRIAWPSQSTIAASIGFHEHGRGVRDLIHALESHGFLEVSKPGRGGSSRYRLISPSDRARRLCGALTKTVRPDQDRHKAAGQDRHKAAGQDRNPAEAPDFSAQDRHKRAGQTGTNVPVILLNEPIENLSSRFEAVPARSELVESQLTEPKRLGGNEAATESSQHPSRPLSRETGKKLFAALKAGMGSAAQ